MLSKMSCFPLIGHPSQTKARGWGYSAQSQKLAALDDQHKDIHWTEIQTCMRRLWVDPKEGNGGGSDQTQVTEEDKSMETPR